jgi:hypothetical protein
MDVFDRRRKEILFIKDLPVFCHQESDLRRAMIDAVVYDGGVIDGIAVGNLARSFYRAVRNLEIDNGVCDFDNMEQGPEWLMLAFEGLALHLGAFRLNDMSTRSLEELTSPNDIVYAMVLVAGKYLFNKKLGTEPAPELTMEIRKEFSTKWLYDTVRMLSLHYYSERGEVLDFPDDSEDVKANKMVNTPGSHELFSLI